MNMYDLNEIFKNNTDGLKKTAGWADSLARTAKPYMSGLVEHAPLAEAIGQGFKRFKNLNLGQMANEAYGAVRNIPGNIRNLGSNYRRYVGDINDVDNWLGRARVSSRKARFETALKSQADLARSVASAGAAGLAAAGTTAAAGAGAYSMLRPQYRPTMQPQYQGGY